MGALHWLHAKDMTSRVGMWEMLYGKMAYSWIQGLIWLRGNASV